MFPQGVEGSWRILSSELQALLKKTSANDVQTKKRIDSTIRLLETDPYVGKPLRGALTDKWSLRNGDYRIIYMITEDEKIVLLYDVRHRKKVYK